jgi:hypothetical protein
VRQKRRGAANHFCDGDMTISRTDPPLKRSLLTIALALSVLVSACGDETVSESPGVAPPAAEVQSPAQLKWLRLTDGIAPEQWLASREAGRQLDLYDPAVIDMHHVLERASARFRDLPRMIANRAVQLEAMLSEKRIAEKAPRLIVSLSQVPGERRYVESFGALTQQYYNLRLEGFSRAEALEALKRQGTPH